MSPSGKYVFRGTEPYVNALTCRPKRSLMLPTGFWVLEARADEAVQTTSAGGGVRSKKYSLGCIEGNSCRQKVIWISSLPPGRS